MNASKKISRRRINAALNQPAETNKERIAVACLHNAVSQESLLNYAAIMEGFGKFGILPGAIIPRVNVFTAYAWLALGYKVMPAEKYNGVQVQTLRFWTDKADGQRKSYMKKTYVYHVMQVEKIAA
jgi:hypothetical protein